MNDNGAGALVGLFLILALFGVGYIGYNWGQSELRREAVQNGVAEYVVKNQEIGTTEFKWKTPK